MSSSVYHLLWLLLLQLPFQTSAQNVTMGSFLSTLNYNLSWNSPSGEFSFGFRRTQGEDLFLLAIWFSKIPLETIIWTANDGKPVKGGSKVQLTTDGVLSLSNPNGGIIWEARPINGTKATSAAMLNSGNFVLTSNDFTIKWASFEHPTDTLLPTQIVNLGGMLISRLSQTNYTFGRFQLILQTDGNLVLYPLARFSGHQYAAYWASNTQFLGSQLVFDQFGRLYLTLRSGRQINYTTWAPSTRDYYLRATLDFNGVFRQYIHQKSSTGIGKWSPFEWSIPDNICSIAFGEIGSGLCGINSYCTLQDQMPTCQCPPGYSYFDPNNIYGGCKQSFVPQSCETDKLRVATGYKMELIPSMDWLKADYARYESVTEDWCLQTCLVDCLCAVAITREGNCSLIKFPLSNGRLSPDSKGNALIKVGPFTEQVLPPVRNRNKKSRDKWIMPGSILFGSSAFLNLLFISFILISIYCSVHKEQFRKRRDTSAFGFNLQTFTYKELEEATDGFKEELGHGDFSIVYKGRLQSLNERCVAVKRLDKVAREMNNEFKMEVSVISQTNHKNLVQLLGFCNEGSNRLLVYEYMKNGSLADLLFGSSRPDWNLRIQIAFGIARGLAYLHEDCSTQIIHCNLQPHNILLDEYFIARISDFGLAKLLKSNQSRTNATIRGRKGYVAPEWFKNVAVSAKVDVYSFGVLLLEIISCRRNVEVGSEDTDILSDWAYDCYVDGKIHLLVNTDEAAKNDKILERLVMVAIWCIQEDPFLRPSMKKVTQMLEGAVEVSVPPDPCPSSFSTSIGYNALPIREE